MYDCDSILEQISLQLDGQLAPDRAQELQASVAESAECGPLVEAMRRADAVLRNEPMLAPPLDLVPAVMARIKEEEARRGRWLGLTLLVGGAMSLWPTLLLAFGLVMVMLTSVYPGTAGVLADLLIMGAGALLTLLQALGTLQESLAPWLAPAVAATLSLLLLALTFLWAQRNYARPSYVEIQPDLNH